MARVSGLEWQLLKDGLNAAAGRSERYRSRPVPLIDPTGVS